jgi:pyridoxamine 5'-phosphate oxidase
LNPPLFERDADPEPLRMFQAWFAEARDTGMELPEAVALATATADGAPSARMVLLKGADEAGLVFFTSYLSRKSHELGLNPRAALLFHWRPLGRQVRVEGAVDRVSADETERYVRSRPRASQISALASPQSQVIEGREELEKRVADLTRRYADHDPPLPSDWGGWRLKPEAWEFWQDREDRLHDRLRYRRADAGGPWVVERLGP